MPKALEPDRISITSPGQLHSELNALLTALNKEETEHTWEIIDKALKRFHAVIRGGVHKSYPDELVKGMKDKDVVKGLVRSLVTERTRLSGTALDLLAACTRLGHAFQPLVTPYLPTILRLFCRTNKLYIARALACVQSIIIHTHLGDVLKYIVIEWKAESGKSSSFREKAAEAVGVMLGTSGTECMVNRDTLDKRIDELEWVIKVGATDREPKVRAEIKKCWEVYKSLWPERVATFTAPMTPVIRRYLNVTGAPAGAGPSGTAANARIALKKPKVPSALSTSTTATDSHPKASTSVPSRTPALAGSSTASTSSHGATSRSALSVSHGPSSSRQMASTSTNLSKSVGPGHPATRDHPIRSTDKISHAIGGGAGPSSRTQSRREQREDERPVRDRGDTSKPYPNAVTQSDSSTSLSHSTHASAQTLVDQAPAYPRTEHTASKGHPSLSASTRHAPSVPPSNMAASSSSSGSLPPTLTSSSSRPFKPSVMRSQTGTGAEPRKARRVVQAPPPPLPSSSSTTATPMGPAGSTTLTSAAAILARAASVPLPPPSRRPVTGTASSTSASSHGPFRPQVNPASTSKTRHAPALVVNRSAAPAAAVIARVQSAVTVKTSSIATVEASAMTSASASLITEAGLQTVKEPDKGDNKTTLHTGASSLSETSEAELDRLVEMVDTGAADDRQQDESSATLSSGLVDKAPEVDVLAGLLSHDIAPTVTESMQCAATEEVDEDLLEEEEAEDADNHQDVPEHEDQAPTHSDPEAETADDPSSQAVSEEIGIDSTFIIESESQSQEPVVVMEPSATGIAFDANGSSATQDQPVEPDVGARDEAQVAASEAPVIHDLKDAAVSITEPIVDGTEVQAVIENHMEDLSGTTSIGQERDDIETFIEVQENALPADGEERLVEETIKVVESTRNEHPIEESESECDDEAERTSQDIDQQSPTPTRPPRRTTAAVNPTSASSSPTFARQVSRVASTPLATLRNRPADSDLHESPDEVFAQSCSIIMETPPRFDVPVGGDIRLPVIKMRSLVPRQVEPEQTKSETCAPTAELVLPASLAARPQLASTAVLIDTAAAVQVLDDSILDLGSDAEADEALNDEPQPMFLPDDSVLDLVDSSYEDHDEGGTSGEQEEHSTSSILFTTNGAREFDVPLNDVSVVSDGSETETDTAGGQVSQVSRRFVDELAPTVVIQDLDVASCDVVQRDEVADEQVQVEHERSPFDFEQDNKQLVFGDEDENDGAETETEVETGPESESDTRYERAPTPEPTLVRSLRSRVVKVELDKKTPAKTPARTTRRLPLAELQKSGR